MSDRAASLSPRALRFWRLLCRCIADGSLKKVTFSLPLPGPEAAPGRITGRLSRLRECTVLSCESVWERGRVSHCHVPADDPEGTLAGFVGRFGRIYLATAAGEAELLASKKGTVTLRGVAALEGAEPTVRDESLLPPPDRQIRYYFDGNTPFLQELGISDASGRVHDKKQSKYRQINRFLELFDDVYAALPAEGPLVVYDLCCGKSYLSFALFAFLRDRKARQVQMLCMDLKEDVMAECARTAQRLGFGGMTFRAGDIRELPRDVRPDMVVSLHACDVATDIVLDTAADLGARLILSTPCCHRYINRKLTGGPLSFVTSHPHLRARLGETLTDALRLLRLESRGYAVEACELIDQSDTPKNTLLRAVRKQETARDACTAKADEYQAALRFLLGEGAENYLKDI